MLHEPFRIVGTIVVSLATLGILMIIKRYTFVYGRRRIVFTVLIGFFLGWLSRDLLIIHTRHMNLEFHSIGLIIPGLIANWMDRQGVVPTITMMLITATLARLILVLVSGGTVGLADGVPL
jgi:poly-gamma-glutamate biosynthesis protein PgsC/CapC